MAAVVVVQVARAREYRRLIASVHHVKFLWGEGEARGMMRAAAGTGSSHGARRTPHLSMYSAVAVQDDADGDDKGVVGASSTMALLYY